MLTGNVRKYYTSMTYEYAYNIVYIANDIMQNINPLTLIIVIPIMDRVFYPLMRRIGVHMKPIRRIAIGFFFAALAMAVSFDKIRMFSNLTM